MKFEQFRYERPVLEEVESEFKNMLKEFKESTTLEECETLMKEINSIRNRVDTMVNICYIRHTIDTNDEFYQTEQDYMDELQPSIQGLVSEYYRALIDSPHRKSLEDKWGSQLFDLADAELKTFSPEIVPLLQKENKLSSQYTKLLASAKIQFKGKEYTLAQLQPFTESKDREIRRESSEVRIAFFQEHEKELDTIFDELVKVRTDIAQKLGYKNFVELGYYRMTRTDYNAEMVKVFRDQVKEHVVPLATELKKRQKKRIGIDHLKYFDEGFEFDSGNATPKGSAQWIMENGQKMYKELSPQTDDFFSYLINNNLMDLEAKKGKAGGGYCTYISDYKAPFIFSNFNGTSGDIDVLTHEAGHAFQVYSSKDFEIPEYIWPTYEACEIHSMSMEFLTWPWMELFFEEETEKYKFSHLSSGLLFLPYGVAVDEFQHYVYENPNATPQERKIKWRKLEEKYLPHKDYDGNEYLESGGYWQRQSHIYTTPFYYIDYTLAQICAFQFWNKSNEGEAVWDDYLSLCRLGGSQSFLNLVKSANLLSPFEEGSVHSVVEPIRKWLEKVNDREL
ncbi:M3 family oligoendopeptidase [Bacillus pakistanensis]|uniref:M3 family oligoendopeptidase n=1 Tax=Rossellomorea pakistanensis TaxID=992288 RepID=A0ABS2NFK6_9BACI|nr:M3 family oligoendopeptidase [Bacillus pakistanensis]MBM7586617.1 M3 family oligoendopeptidase [Bacillus pakistanensis]